jgi:hypothetical protein
MANRKSRNSRKATRSPRTGTSPSAGAAREGRAKDVDLALKTAADLSPVMQAAAKEDLDPQVVTPVAANAEDRLLQAYDALAAQRTVYEQCGDRAARREREADAALERAESAAQSAEAERIAVGELKSGLEAIQAELGAKAQDLRAREAEVLAREAQAATGFQDLLDRKEQAISDRLKFEHEQRLAAVKAAEAAVDERQRQLDDEQAELIEKSSELRTREYGVLRRSREIDAEIASVSAERIQELETRVRLADIRVNGSAEEIHRLELEQAETRAKWAAVGNRDPKGLLQELERLRDQNQELQHQLAERLDVDDLERLHALERANQELKEERSRLQRMLDEMESRAVYDQASHLKARQLKDAQEHYDLVVVGYQQQLDALSDSYRKFIASKAEDPAAALFPSCTEIDTDDEYAFTAVEDDGRIDLHRFARDLQGSMWKDSRRAYRLDDVCAFLGGLAMSRLHLLEGMSGIGKTSLPLAFAKALGTHCEIIEVQAGWRDQHDLFGHYNSFEKRFQETPFLKALYKAGSPRHRNRPFFIVLDEMNLSRPEQYFSVLLSRLESEDESPIHLAPPGSGQRPARFELDGTGIGLPPNVWFIGTANQDESTLEFADKTYNRAFLLELPPVRPWVPSGGDVAPFTHDALRRSFAEAKVQHRKGIAIVNDLLSRLRDDLFDIGRVQVGPRLESQLAAFLPVFAAARGTESEARQDAGPLPDACDPVALGADQFIAAKILRQIRTRFEVTTDEIDHLEQVLNEAWAVIFPGSGPERCAQVFTDERRRRSA